MTTVLVVDDDKLVRDVTVRVAFDAGLDVIEASNGQQALEIAIADKPDIILLDMKMPRMDGFAFLHELRENPSTEAIPVVAVTALTSGQGELAAWRLGVRHYVVKPFTVGRIALTVRVALREAKELAEEEDADPIRWFGSADSQGVQGEEEKRNLVRTGSQPLNQILSGGFPIGTLTILEGTPSSGKSVLSQHLAHESLTDDHRVAYFTSGTTAQGLLKQMASLGLTAGKRRLKDSLRITPLQDPSPGEDTDASCSPDTMLATLAREIELLDRRYDIVIVDDLTKIASYCNNRTVLRFFSSCRRVAEQGRTVFLTARSHAFDDRLLSRLRDLADAHVSLRGEKMGPRSVTTLEVLKADNADMNTANLITFDVQPGTGINVLPFSKVKSEAQEPTWRQQTGPWWRSIRP